MKRLISILLTAVILILSLSTGAFAAEPTVPKDIDTSNGISAEMETAFAPGGTNTTLNIAVKGDKAAIEFKLDFLKIKIILRDAAVYIFSPTIPFFHGKADASEIFPDFDDSDIQIDDITLKETVEKTIDGKTYIIERYISDDGYGFDVAYLNNEPEYIELTMDEIIFGRIDNFNFEVDDSVFELPRFSLDITPVINFFLGFFSGILDY